MRGFTLTELLITMTIMAILAGLAAPSLIDTIRANRVSSLASELTSQLNFARSEAIKRGVRVTVCKSANTGSANPTCTNAGTWEQGWLIYTDTGTVGTFDGTDARLRINQPAAGQATITGSANIVNYLSFDSRGAASTSGTFTVCQSPSQRVVNVSLTGRTRIVAGSC